MVALVEIISWSNLTIEAYHRMCGQLIAVLATVGSYCNMLGIGVELWPQ